MSAPIDYESDEFKSVMSKTVRGTDLLVFEVYELGEAFLNWINAVRTLGHTSPGSTLDYIPSGGNVPTEIVRDFVAWTSGRKQLAPNCKSRLYALLDEAKWHNRETPLLAALAADGRRSA